MSLKDLFQNKSQNIINTSNLTTTGSLLESYEQIKTIELEQNRYISKTDFSDPKNFARFGSAELYYNDSIKNIYTTYPYDGSSTDKKNWELGLTDLESYIFNKVYPKSTGHVTLNISGSPQYIKFDSNTSIPTNGKLATYFETNLNKKSLNITGSEGLTIEFWAKFPIQPTSTKTILFLSSSTGFSNIGLSGSSFIVYNSSPVTNINFGLSGKAQLTEWNHYAITSINSGSNGKYSLYINGQLSDTKTSSKIQNHINPSGSIGTSYDTPSATALSASLDEFRIWSTCRTPLEIGRNWSTAVDSSDSLELYYKFNEGIISTDSVNQSDSTIIDYSGKIRNGTYINYKLGSRSTESAINLSNLENIESADPIIRYTNPLVVQTLANYTSIGFEHDTTNNKSIYKSIPSWILEEEEEANKPNLKFLTQIMASYFDDLYNKAIDIADIHNLNYSSGSLEAYPFYSKLLESKGFTAPNLFVNANVIEQLLSRTDEDTFELKLDKIKNQIYQNIYNNLMYIYKSKGTEKSIKNLLRAYGVDENLVKINVYTDGGEYKFEDTFSETSIKKKKIDFAKNFFSSTIYQKKNPSNSDSLSYIPAIQATVPFDLSYLTPLTYEVETILPTPFDITSNKYADFSYVSSSIFGVHTAKTDGDQLGWESTDPFNFKVYTVRPVKHSNNAMFLLDYKIGNVSGSLTSSYYNDAYSNSKWNLAVRIKPNIDTLAGTLASGSDDYFNKNLSYTLELIGAKSISGEIVEEFSVSNSFSGVSAVTSSLISPKRLYLGAHCQDFTGSVLTFSDIQAVSAKVWYDYLTDEEIKFHAKTLGNYGRQFLSDQIDQGSNTTKKHESLVLNWSFETVSGSDSGGNFYTLDASNTIIRDSSLLSGISNKYYDGYGDKFAVNSSEFIIKDYITTTKQNMPEVVQSSDMITIKDDESIVFDNKITPNKYYISIENNMYQVISEEILNMFAGIISFNDLIGDVKNKYEASYRGLDNLKEIFFRKINNTPKVEKYLEFYKWIDSSLGMMIEQLIPSTTRYSKGLTNIVESHILERAKYQHQKPLITTRIINPNSPIRGREELKIAWSPTLASDNDGSSEITNTSYDKTYALEGAKEYVGSDSIAGPRISNVKVSDSLVIGSQIGNYRFAYDVVQTVGRPSNNKNIFVNKFESPSGSILKLDISDLQLTSEYSVYAGLAYRNYSARKNLLTSLAQTSSLPSSVSASEHRTVKNPSYGFTYLNSITTSSFAVRVEYDNALIQHQIPRSDKQYAWITASLLTQPSSSGFASQYPNLNTELNLFVPTLISASTHQLTQSAGWKGLQDKIFGVKDAYNRKNNIIGYNNVSSAVEPVVEWNLPMKHIINVDSASRDTEILSSYNNEKNSFANKLLKDATEAYVKKDDTVYDQLKDIDSGLEIKQIEFNDYIIPRKEKVGLYEIRSRNLNSEIVGTASLGQNPANLIKFWDSNINKRVRNGVSGSSGWGIYDYYNTLNYRDSLISNSAGDAILVKFSSSVTPFITHNIKKSSSLSSINPMDNYVNLDTQLLLSKTSPPYSGTFFITISSSIRGELADFDAFEKRNMVYLQTGSYTTGNSDGKTINLFKYKNNGEYRVKPRAYFNNTINYNSVMPYSYVTSSAAYSHGLVYNKGYQYVTDLISNKIPAYSSYEEYLSDIKPISKNYSLLPEYRIEDHFENFIANNLDYTKYTNSNYLSLRGMDSDIEDLALSKQIDNVVSVKDKKKKIKFKFNIIKKLLPYNGFYPQNRSVKIVEQFQKSFFEINDDIVQGDNVISYSSEDSLNKIGNNTPLDQQIQTILQPFFAPGLLFNSIKAGMSVTFPVFIGNVSSEASSRFPYYDAASESFLNNIYSTGSFLGNRKYNFPYTLSGSNNTFIFTDLLDPFYKLYQYKTLYRNGISQNLQNEGNTLLYIAPDAYGLSIPSNKIAYPSFHRKKLYSDIFNQGKNINLYKLLINNFISEIPNFFIENKKLTSFFSKDETQFKTFTAGVAYYMDLVLERDEDIKSSLEVGFSVPNETFGLSAFTMTEGAAYGYPFSVSNNRTLTISSDYGYAPVSPPYINGKTTLRFKFVPSETRSYSLEEIQNSCELENINDDLYFSILTSSFTPENSPCYTERMLLEKCINPFGKTIRNNISYDQFGNVVQVAETSTPNKIWTIHTLFESPILNFNTSQNYNHAYSSVLENEFFAFNYLGAPTYESWSIRTIQSVGMWTGYGEIPKNNGVSLSIQESFNKNLTTGSLLDQCGFNIETKNIGVVANKKQISEGILVLPYLNYNSDTVTDKTDIIESKRKTIKISKSAIDAALKTNFDTIADVKQLKKILNSTNVDKNNSIIKTMKAMLEYNIPAHLDWIVDRTLEPIAMYIAEVKHDLDQQDLVDIWQGLLPKIGTTAELDEVTIEHDLADDQILNNLDDIDSLKFKVFKVKKKANINYYDLTDDSSDDTRFKFIFNNERKTPNYSYNWPYDHFSLAELVNIEAGYTYITGSI